MAPVMAKKKADNAARKAAAAQARAAAANAEAEAPMSSAVGPASAPASIRAKRKAPTPRNDPPARKKRRTMNATMDGAADDSDSDDAGPASGPLFTHHRKLSEYERFQQLTSPTRSHGRRQRRPAALRASQSFSKFTDDGDEDDDDEVMDGDNEEDVETEIKKQFDSEYDHFQALTSPDQIPGVLVGKRKRKPVINLEEAMRIEAGDDDDFLE